ncbi:MAG: 3-ketoacyl-CoA thiolase [Actinomycetota bacterium]|nr:3-ketoacyl-CoA thiolase [Actinomycetota bacterium]
MVLNTLDRVAVVASAQTSWREAWSGLQHVDLISRAVEGVLRGSGLRMQDVDVVIDCGSDVLDGRSISNCGFLGAMGANHKEESRVEEDGLFGAVYGTTKVAAGSAAVALIVAYSKPSESDVSGYYATLTEPFYQRALGLDHLGAAGLMANQYLTSTDADEDALLQIAVEAWRKAGENPLVEMGAVPSRADIEASDLVADPLRVLQISRPLDGAVAVLLATERVARRVTDRPVWITGMGSAMDNHFIADRAPGQLEACQAAARMAVKRAGLTDVSGVGLAEVTAGSAAGEAMVVEALGFAARGHAVDCYGDGATVLINPSGGALPADPIMATGLVRLAEASERLAGRFGDDKVGSRAIVHGAGGLGMQNHCVFTLEV